MRWRHSLSIFMFVFLLGGCSWFRHGDNVDPVKLAQQLLDAQKDQYGDPKPVNLPVRVNYTVTKKPLIDHDLAIEFEIIAEKAVPKLRIGLTTTDGLELSSSDVRELYENLKPRQTITADVVVEPKRESEFYLNVFVVTESGEERLAKLIKIPIAIGEYSLKKVNEK